MNSREQERENTNKLFPFAISLSQLHIVVPTIQSFINYHELVFMMYNKRMKLLSCSSTKCSSKCTLFRAARYRSVIRYNDEDLSVSIDFFHTCVNLHQTLYLLKVRWIIGCYLFYISRVQSNVRYPFTELLGIGNRCDRFRI